MRIYFWISLVTSANGQAQTGSGESSNLNYSSGALVAGAAAAALLSGDTPAPGYSTSASTCTSAASLASIAGGRGTETGNASSSAAYNGAVTDKSSWDRFIGTTRDAADLWVVPGKFAREDAATSLKNSLTLDGSFASAGYSTTARALADRVFLETFGTNSFDVSIGKSGGVSARRDATTINMEGIGWSHEVNTARAEGTTAITHKLVGGTIVAGINPESGWVEVSAADLKPGYRVGLSYRGQSYDFGSDSGIKVSNGWVLDSRSGERKVELSRGENAELRLIDAEDAFSAVGNFSAGDRGIRLGLNKGGLGDDQFQYSISRDSISAKVSSGGYSFGNYQLWTSGSVAVLASHNADTAMFTSYGTRYGSARVGVAINFRSFIEREEDLGASWNANTEYGKGVQDGSNVCFGDQSTGGRELSLIDAFGGVSSAVVISTARKRDICYHSSCVVSGVGCSTDADCPFVRRLLAESVPSCTLREANTFGVSSVYSILVEKCLTLNGIPDQYSDVLKCVISTLPTIGITLLNSGCFDCLVDFIHTEINLSEKILRNACIADPFSDTCLNGVDFTSLISCTNGYDPRFPIIKPYCSKEEAINAIAWSVYRTTVVTCVSNSTIVSNSTELTNCLGFVFDNSELSKISTDCFSCWNDFFGSVAKLNMTDMGFCSQDPTGMDCNIALSPAVVAFSNCAGFNPLMMDYTFLTQIVAMELTDSNSVYAVYPGFFAILLTITFVLSL